VFPVEHWLGPRRIRPGATVAVRGFALTFIDAALALTEGRGARFETTDHPFRLDYAPADDEVGVLVPFSRSGRPMPAKPSPRMAARLPELELIAAPARRRVLELAADFAVDVELSEIIEAVAEASLHAAGGVARPPSPDPAAELERSLAIATDVEPPDAQWALGHAWRTLYPALVARLGGQGVAAEQWPAFRSLALRMERIAFGPPPVNAAKLLALIEAGRVDLGHLGGWIERRGSTAAIVSEAGERAIDTVVDAVLAGPGALGLHSELLQQLVGDGHCRVMPGRRGLEVADDASCIDARGNLSGGLSAIGRPTEDSVIGNDTLSRSLHPHAGRWAHRVVERCSDASRSEVAVR
jgi:diaminopimelate decarboxylase